MSGKVISIVVLLAFLAITEGGIVRRSLGMTPHCRCIQKESQPIGRYIQKVELIPVNSHCDETEIIATLKNTGQEICLDPRAPWVNKVIQKILKQKRR
ncbi:growth-regulated alpha protein [Lampris incognitus]|uniref:growth-regulated alpha protein n=1 Tax=Lampris incognitus TaxID=2546036 RepID=UPI0024B4BD80|nr:growth-regulated alpha protein [Lampris incognitus]